MTEMPEQPSYDAETILEDLRQHHDLQDESDWLDEYGMTASEAYTWVDNQLTEGSDESYKTELEKDTRRSHELREKYWKNEADTEWTDREDGKIIHYALIQEDEDPEQTILYSETEFT